MIFLINQEGIRGSIFFWSCIIFLGILLIGTFIHNHEIMKKPKPKIGNILAYIVIIAVIAGAVLLMNSC